jgi:hypothetical protein
VRHLTKFNRPRDMLPRDFCATAIWSHLERTVKKKSKPILWTIIYQKKIGISTICRLW